MADLERIRNVALKVKREVDRGFEVAVVVSAMSGETNKLVNWARELSPLHDAREYDANVWMVGLAGVGAGRVWANHQAGPRRRGSVHWRLCANMVCFIVVSLLERQCLVKYQSTPAGDALLPPNATNLMFSCVW